MGFSTAISTATLRLKLGYVGGGNMTAGSPNLTSVGFTPLPWQMSGRPFGPSDVGAQISVIGAGANPPAGVTLPSSVEGGAMLVTTVASYVSGSSVVLAANAGNAVTNGNANVTIYRQVPTWESGAIRFNSSLSARDTLSFSVLSLDGSQVVAVGMPVLLMDDNLGDLFGGSIDQVVGNQIVGSAAIEWQCQCVSWDARLTARFFGPAINLYTNLTTRALFEQAIWTRATSDGFSTDPSMITGATVASESFSADTSVASALDTIVQDSFSSTTSYYWYVDPWKVVRLQTGSTLAAPWNVSDQDGSQGNALNRISVTTTREKLANRVYVSETNQILGNVTDTLHGDGSSKTYNVQSALQSAPISITTNGSVNTFGIQGIDTGKQFYWAPGSNSIILDPSLAPLGSVDTLRITYTAVGTSLAFEQDITSINARAAIEGGSGYSDAYFTQDKIAEPGAGAAAAQAYANQLGEIPLSVEFTTFRGGLRTTQNIVVQLAKFGVNATMLIDSISLDTANNQFLWTVHCVDGAIIGDWRTALINLAGGSTQGGGGSLAPPTLAASPSAPNILSVTTLTPVYTVVGGIPSWYVTGQIALKITDANFAHLKSINVPIDGFDTSSFQISAANFPPNGTDLSIGTPNTRVTSIGYAFQSGDASKKLNIYAGTGFTVAQYAVNSVAAGNANLSSGAGTIGSTSGTWALAIQYVSKTYPLDIASHTYTAEFQCINDDGVVTASPVTASFTVTPTGPAGPATVPSATGCTNAGYGLSTATVTAAGSGYTNGTYHVHPTGIFSCGLIVRVTGGVVVSITIQNPGYGATSPALSGSFAGGTGATFAFTTGPVQYTDTLGLPVWGIHAVGFLAPGTADPLCDSIAMTMQLCDVSLNPAPAELGGVEVAVGTWVNLGQICQLNDTGGRGINEMPFPPASASAFTYPVLRLYSVSANATGGWQDAANSTLQNVCWSGADHLAQTIGAAATDTIDASYIAHGSLGDNIIKDATTGKPKVGTSAPSNAVQNPGFEDNLTSWTVSTGSVSIQTSASGITPYAGNNMARLDATNTRLNSSLVSCKPGQLMVASFQAQSSAGSPNTLQLYWNFVAADKVTSISSPAGPTAASSVGAWAQLIDTQIAPAGSSYVYILAYLATVASDKWYIDNADIHPATPATSGLKTDASGNTVFNPDGSTLGLSGNQAIINSGGVQTLNIAGLAVTNPKLASLAVQAANLASSSVTSSAIASAAVTSTAIASAAVTSAAIANLAVGTAAIANLAVGNAQLANLAVNDAKVSDLSVSKLLAGTIAVAVSLTAPTITVTGSPFTINLDSTNGFKCSGNGITATFTNSVSFGGTYAALRVFNNTSPNRQTRVGDGIVQTMCANAAGMVELDSTGFAGVVRTYDASGVQKAYMDGSLGTIHAEYNVDVAAGQFFSVGGSSGFTGTLAAAIAAGKNVAGGIILA